MLLSTSKLHSITDEFFDQNVDIQSTLGGILPKVRHSCTTRLRRSLVSPEQRLLGHHQIAQRTSREQPVSILPQPPVAHLGETELPLDDAKLVFHFRTHFGFVAVPGAFILCQRAVAMTFGLSEVFGPWRAVRDGLRLPLIGGVAPHPGFFAMEQVGQHLGIVNVRRRDHHRVNELGATVDTDMALHAEIPLVALASLVHLRIAFLLLVLGRTGRTDDGGIDDRTTGYLQTVLLKVLIDQMEQLIAQVVLLHQMAELADRGFVRCRLTTEINAHELAQGAGVVEGFFCGWIGQVEPMLEKMNAQHALDADGTAPGTLRFGIERLYSLAQLFPGNDVVHLFEKLFLASLLAEFLETGFGKRVLAHAVQPGGC